MSLKRNLIVKFDFDSVKFDGNCRQAHQFIPFLVSKLQFKGLSYLLDETKHPDPVLPKYIGIIERSHTEQYERAALLHEENVALYHTDTAIYDHQVVGIMSSDKTERQKHDSIRNINRPVYPVLRLPETQLTSAVSNQIKETKAEYFRFNREAGMALEEIKLHLSDRLLQQCSTMLQEVHSTQRAKLLGIYHWLKSHVFNERQVIMDVRMDLENLPSIFSFSDAVSTIDAMNALNGELVTLGHGLSDKDLILIHSGKLAKHEKFTALRVKYTQDDALRGVINAPSSSPVSRFSDITPVHPSVFTWVHYCSEVTRYDRAESDSTCSTVLQARAVPVSEAGLSPEELDAFRAYSAGGNQRFRGDRRRDEFHGDRRREEPQGDRRRDEPHGDRRREDRPRFTPRSRFPPSFRPPTDQRQKDLDTFERVLKEFRTYDSRRAPTVPSFPKPTMPPSQFRTPPPSGEFKRSAPSTPSSTVYGKRAYGASAQENDGEPYNDDHAPDPAPLAELSPGEFNSEHSPSYSPEDISEWYASFSASYNDE